MCDSTLTAAVLETSVCGRALRITCTLLPSISCFSVSPAGCCSKLLGVELLPMMLLASQELSARAATHDQHLKGGAQPFAAENTSNMWVLTWQRSLKTRPRLYLNCDCRPGLAGRVLTARSFLY